MEILVGFGRVLRSVGIAATPDRVHSMALAVDEIIDVVADRLTIELRSDKPGSLGTAVVAGRAVESIDVDYYLMRAIAEHFQRGSGLDGEELAA